MAKLFAQMIAEVKSLVPNVDAIGETAITNCMNRAITTLSKRSPRNFSRIITGDGSAQEWLLDSATYKVGFSAIVVVYYPWDDTEDFHPVDPLDQTDFALYEKTSATNNWYLKLKFITPTSSEKVRIVYTSPHTVTEAASTITNDKDENDAILLAASFCLLVLAIKAIATSNSTINADTVDYQSRSSQYRQMADDYASQSGLKQYIEESTSAAGVFLDLGEQINPAQYLLNELP